MLTFCNSVNYPTPYHDKHNVFHFADFQDFVKGLDKFKSGLRHLFNYEKTFETFEVEVNSFKEMIDNFMTTCLRVNIGKLNQL